MNFSTLVTAPLTRSCLSGTGRILWITLAVLLCCNSAMAEFAVDSSACVILPPGMSRPTAGKPFYLQLQLSNKNSNLIKIENYRRMGLEHINDLDPTVAEEHISGAYFDQVKVHFINTKTGKVTTRWVYFPFCGTIEPGKIVEILLTVTAPKVPGEYSIKTEYVRDEREGILINAPGEQFKAKFEIANAHVEASTVFRSGKRH